MRRRIGNIFANSTTRESHPPNCTPLPPPNPPHTGASLRHMRGANVKCIKNAARRRHVKLPSAGSDCQPSPSTFFFSPSSSSFARVLAACLITTRGYTQNNAIFGMHAASRSRLRPSSSSPCRLSGAGSKGGGGPQLDGAESCERARAARKIAQNPT